MSLYTEEVRSWLDWFEEKYLNDIINKSKQELLFDKYGPTSNSKKVIRDLEEDPNIVFMFCQSFGEKKVNVFHHFKKFGGSILENEVGYAFVQGMEKIQHVSLIPTQIC